nr:uncharacterized protein LOC115266837 [Aedes albopictus]
MDCKKCTSPVITKSQPFIYCNGLCATVYHATCVELSKSELAAVSPPNRNSFWLCDECFTEFIHWRNDRKGNVKESTAVAEPLLIPEQQYAQQRDVDELKMKVDFILTVLASTASCHVDTGIMPHSTPNSSRSSDSEMIRPNECTPMASVHASPARLSNPVGGEESFALVLTNIDGSVSEEDIQLMVARCLGASDAECRNVRKLVPRWVDCSTLDYISFKIVLNCKWKSTAMASATWPSNLKFRELKRRESTWKPDTV